ncbi:MAG TPA: outer membrane beta-barrel protein [Tepidisphaeraceae bacterium]|jgi:outer membrane protein W|nr:outer membrane beta-barrel protein [Tepidisphaeraceae bacterium]
MWRKALVLAALCLIPAVAHAQAARGPFEIELGGDGTNGPNFNGFTAAADASIGYFFTDNLELDLRQTAAYSDVAGVGWDASTDLAIDFNVPLGDQAQWMPYIGANIGYVYGNSVRNTWEAAPEAGVKYFVNSSTFIYVSAEYQFFFNQNSTAGSALRNGQFIYGLGVGFRF